MGNIGFSELLVIMIIVLVVFGAKRVPEIGRSIGRGVHEFKRALNGHTNDSAQPPIASTEQTPPPNAKG